MTKNEVNVNDVIQETYEIPPSLYDGKFTKTAKFLLPSISLNVRNKFVAKFFQNAFLGDKEYQHDIERALFILFKVDKFDEEWKVVYEALCKKKEYIMDYECGMNNDSTLIMIVFQVPEEYSNEYYRFKQGKYSKFSKEYKEFFPKMITDEVGNEVESITWGAMNLSETLRTKMNNLFRIDPKDPDVLQPGDEIWEAPRKYREYYRSGEDAPKHIKASV